MKKKLLSLLLVATMLLSLMPTVYAEDATSPAEGVKTATVTIKVNDWNNPEKTIENLEVVLSAKNKVGDGYNAQYHIAEGTTDSTGVATLTFYYNASNQICNPDGTVRQFALTKTVDTVSIYDEVASGGNPFVLSEYTKNDKGVENGTRFDCDFDSDTYKYEFGMKNGASALRGFVINDTTKNAAAITAGYALDYEDVDKRGATWDDAVLTGNWANEGVCFTFQTYAYDGTVQEPATVVWTDRQGAVIDTYKYPAGTARATVEGETRVKTPSEMGWTFQRWEYTTSASVPETLVSGKTYVVDSVWMEKTYTIKFDGNGGKNTFNQMGNKTVSYTQEFGIEGGFTRTGYMQVGFKLKGDTADTFYANGTSLNVKVLYQTEEPEDLTLTFIAQWLADGHNLDLKANGGQFKDGKDTKRVSVTYDQAVTGVEEPTRTGYSFDGWQIMENDKLKSWTIPTKWDVDGSVTAYAKWAPADNTYTVVTKTEKLNDTYEETSEGKSAETEAEVSVTPDAPTGFHYNEAASTVTGTVAADGTTKLTVVYDRNTYTVTYKDYNGSTLKEVENVKYGADFPSCELPSETGYTYTWDKTIPDTVTEDTTITAVRDADKVGYKVEYYYQNITDDEYTRNDAETKEYPQAKTGDLILPATGGELSKTGFTYNNEKSETPTEVAGDGSTVVKHYFDRNTYTVKYVDDNGNTLDEHTGVKYEASVPAYAGADTHRDGYSFAWSGIPEDGKVTGELTITGVWTPNQNTAYTVETYIMGTDGKYPTTPSTETKYGTTDTMTNVTAEPKTGFTLQTIEQKNINGNGSTVVKVYYERNKYTLTFNFNDGVTADYVLTDYYNAAVTYPTVPNRDGWNFIGWNLPSFVYMPAMAKTITAQWYHIPYTITWIVNGAETTENYYWGDTPSYKEGGVEVTPTKAEDDYNTYSFKGWTPAIATVTGAATYTAEFTAIPKYHKLTVNYTGAFSWTPTAYSAEIRVGNDYNVATPELEGYEADIPVVSGTMGGEDITVTVTYTCQHEVDNFGICTDPSCPHPADCTCNPDSTHGERSFIIRTRNGGTWAAEAGVPVKLVMNPQKSWDNEHEVIWTGVTGADGIVEVPQEVLHDKVLPGCNLYAIIGDCAEGETQYVWAWTDLSYGKVRTASATANCSVFTSGNNDYVYIMANEGIGFKAETILYVKEAQQAAPVVATIHYVIYDQNGQLINTNDHNLVMSLVKRVNGKATEIGTTAIIDGKGTIQIDASELATLGKGTVLDCNPTVGHYEWAFDYRDLVRTVEFANSDGAEQGTNPNHDIVITDNSKGFEATFYCYLNAVDEEPVAPSYKATLHVVDRDGNALSNVAVELCSRLKGVPTSLGTATTDANGYATFELTLAQVQEILKSGAVIDCGPADGNYEWAFEGNQLVRWLTQATNVMRGNNTNHDVKLTNASLNGFSFTFECVMRPTTVQ